MESISIGEVAACVTAGAISVAAIPILLSTIGFTVGGIAAGSIAAKLMSISAMANTGAVSTGSVMAALQSVGAGGLATGSQFALGGGVAATCKMLNEFLKKQMQIED